MYEREARRTHCLHVGLVEASQERRQQKSQPFLIMSRVASHASRGESGHCGCPERGSTTRVVSRTDFPRVSDLHLQMFTFLAC